MKVEHIVQLPVENCWVKSCGGDELRVNNWEWRAVGVKSCRIKN